LVASAVAPAVTPVASLLVAALLLVAARLALRLRRLRLRLGRWGRSRDWCLEDAEEAREESFGYRRHRLHDLLRGALLGSHRLLAFDLRLGRFRARRLGLLWTLGELVARRHVLHLVQLVVLESLYFVVWRLEVRVGHQHEVHLEASLELLDLGALLVQQEGG